MKYILLLLSPALLFAAGGFEGTDIVPRAINFVIFASILYYLLADLIKGMYKGRIAEIADRLNSIQVKVKESIDAKQAAKEKVEESKASAKTLIETSKKEGQLLAQKVLLDTDSELLNLEKSLKDKIYIETRRMRRDVVASVLDELFEKESISIDDKELVEIVMKKVA